MSGKYFNWGIIGTGGIANAFSRDIKYLENHRISAVLSRSIDTAKSFSSDKPNCTGYDDIDLFLNRSNVDAVYIATPNNLHCDQTIRALNAGKPVLCEKPFSISKKESELMVAASNQNNVALLEGMWTRYLPHISNIQRIIKDGTIGDIESLSAFHHQNLSGVNNPRLWTRELGGGSLLDLGIYIVSFAHMILGSPNEIEASASFTDKGVDSKTSIIFKYDDLQIATLSCSMVDSIPNRAVISGTNGYIDLDPTFYAPTSFRVCTNDGARIEHPNEYEGHGLREQALELEKCVKNNTIESSIFPHAEMLQVMESMDKIRSIIGLQF